MDAEFATPREGLISGTHANPPPSAHTISQRLTRRPPGFGPTLQSLRRNGVGGLLNRIEDQTLGPRFNLEK
jgi:hypothetical protein